jgi:insertion element IS1 protein InsB
MLWLLKPLTQYRECTMGMIIRDVCPRCKSPQYKKNGHIHNGKQNHQCQACGRQFVHGFEPYLVSDETRDLIERLLLERIALRGIGRAVQVGLKWLVGCIANCFEALPDHLHVQPISCNQDVMIQRLEVEADDMASFVQKKANKQWIWLAMDAKTHQIIAFHVRDRSRQSFKKLWAMIPQAYRQHATFSTEQYVVYQGVILAAQHDPIGK